MRRSDAQERLCCLFDMSFSIQLILSSGTANSGKVRIGNGDTWQDAGVVLIPTATSVVICCSVV